MSDALVVGIVRQAIEVAAMVTLPCRWRGRRASCQRLADHHVDSGQRSRSFRARRRFVVFALTFPWMLVCSQDFHGS